MSNPKHKPKSKVKHLGAGDVIERMKETHEEEGFVEFAAVGITKGGEIIFHFSSLSTTITSKLGMVEYLKYKIFQWTEDRTF